MRPLILAVFCSLLCSCAALNPWSETPPVYVVFFAGTDTALSADAKAIVDNAALKARLKPKAMVQIAGPKTEIAPGYDPKSAQPRIDAVINELIAAGVAKEKLVQTSLTTDDAKVDKSGAQRVEIRILDDAG